MPVYLIRIGYNKALGDIVPDQIWRPAVEATGGKILRRVRRVGDLPRHQRNRSPLGRHDLDQAVQHRGAALLAVRPRRRDALDGRARAQAHGAVFSEVSLTERDRSMKSILTPLVLALLLLAAGVAAWTLGQAQERMAQVETQVATMDYGAVADDDGELDRFAGLRDAGAPLRRRNGARGEERSRDGCLLAGAIRRRSPSSAMPAAPWSSAILASCCSPPTPRIARAGSTRSIATPRSSGWTRSSAITPMC